MRAPRDLTAALARDLASARSLEELERVGTAARSILPRSDPVLREPRPVPPTHDEGDWVFDNGFVRARVRDTGAIVELATAGGRNAVAQANLLAASSGRWARRMAREHPVSVDGGLELRFSCGRSGISMRVVLEEDAPFLRVDLAAYWRERRASVALEHWLAIDSRDVVTNERYARATASDGAGVAIFSADGCAWRTRRLRRGGVHFATTLLSGPGWFRPGAPVETAFSFAYAPYRNVPPSAIERAWIAFVHPARVALFVPDDDAVIVTATKPSEAGDSALVTVRECDGAARAVRLHCAGRAKSVSSPTGGDVRLENEDLVFALEPLAERTFRVEF